MGLKRKKNVKVVFREGRGWVVEYRDEFGRRPRPAFPTESEANDHADRVRLALQGFVHVDEVERRSRTEASSARATCPKKAVLLKDALKSYRSLIETTQSRAGFKLSVRLLEEFYLWAQNENEEPLEYLHQFTLETIEKFRAFYMKGKKGKPIKASSVNRAFTCYVAFFNKCVAWKMIDRLDNPVEDLVRLPEEPVEVQTWRPDQIQVALERFPLWAKRVEFFLSRTGRRPIDAERLNWGDVRWDTREYRVITYKGGRPFAQMFPIADDVYSMLNEIFAVAKAKGRANGGDPVFLNARGKRASPGALRQAFYEFRDDAGLTGLKLYWLRHAFITGLVDAGVHHRNVQLLAGHKKFETTTRYTARNSDALKSAVNEHSQRLRLVGGE